MTTKPYHTDFTFFGHTVLHIIIICLAHTGTHTSMTSHGHYVISKEQVSYRHWQMDFLFGLYYNYCDLQLGLLLLMCQRVFAVAKEPSWLAIFCWMSS